MAPGFGVDEEELDSRLNKESIEALRRAHAPDESVARFYLRYLSGLLHGDLGVRCLCTNRSDGFWRSGFLKR